MASERILMPPPEYEEFLSILDMPPKPSARLKELLKNPAPWPETDWGEPQGKEIW